MCYSLGCGKMILVPVVLASEETLKLGEHRSWSEVVFEECFRLLVSGASVRNKARLLCLKNPNSGAWLAVCPSAALRLETVFWEQNSC